MVKRPDDFYRLTDNLRRQKSINTEKAWGRVSRRMALESLQTKVWNFVRTTAAILLPLLMVYQFIIHPMLESTSPAMITLTSAPGIVTKAVLPDGSEVWLNAQSELSYPATFKKNERNVKVSGEAYFKVRADKKNRFNVEVNGDVTVSAYGTEFNIQAYRDDSPYQITLTKGNVELFTNGKDQPQKLAMGQKAILNPHAGGMDVVAADIYVETAWKDGIMAFRREKLEHIAQKLSRKFGVTIQLEDDLLKDYEYTATFTNETLEDILNLLIKSAPITYTISQPEQRENFTYTRRVVLIKSI